MTTLQAGSILRQLRRVALHTGGADLTDGQLLRSFLSRRDEAAFEALVRRHGPMVRGVCRRVLRNSHDADDAFQAAFLVLVRKANGLAEREVIGDWLHGVAYRVALKARTAEAIRRGKERLALRREAVEEEGWPEWLPLLDQEIGRLPEKYRLPVVLCDLEGRTRKEAARQLGWPEGTVAGRLARARTLLAKRLTRRGVTLSAAALASALTGEAVASLPISLVRSTSGAAIALAAGQTAGAISVQVAALTEGVVKAMLLAKWKPAFMLMMVVLAVTIGVGTWRYAATAGPAEEPQQKKSVDAPRDKPKVPVAPVAERNYQIDLRLTRVKDGQRKLLAIPKLLTLEGREASFAIGDAYVFSWREGKFERVTVGPAVRLVVRSEKGNQINVDMTASDSQRGFEPGKEFSVETKSIRLIRKVELGQPFTANLKTGEKDQTVLEVTAAINMADTNGTIEAAEKKLQMAEFWRQTGHPESACFYYDLIRRFYPDTVYAKLALERMSELRPLYGYPAQPILPKQGNEKQPTRVGQLFIIGNKTVTQKSILRRVPLFPGQVLDPADLRIAERNLSRLKSLKSARITVLNPEEESAYKDIRIDVEEK